MYAILLNGLFLLENSSAIKTKKIKTIFNNKILASAIFIQTNAELKNKKAPAKVPKILFGLFPVFSERE